MTVEFSLPDIGEGLHEAEIVRWMVTEGESIGRNQPFVEIMTDKSNVEMPAPAAGVVARLVPAEGDLVQVGDLLIVIDDGSPEIAAASPDPGAGRAGAAAPRPPSDPSATGDRPTDTGPGPTAPGRRPKASPSTRRLAAELAIDLATVSGTGPGGRILADDIRTAAASAAHAPIPVAPAGARTPVAPAGAPIPVTPAGAPTPVAPAGAPTPRLDPSPAAQGRELGWMDTGVHPLRGIRRATARAMDRSWSTIPHISASREIDATPLLEARERLRQRQGELDPDQTGPAITPLALVVLAVARALRRYPMMNAAIDLEAETITVPDRVDIGIAVATEHGLLVPVIHQADLLTLTGAAAEIQRLSTAARDRSIGPEELAGGTHTITNYGSAGGHLAAPIIRPGEAAITGLGGIEERPIVVDGEVVARPTLPVVVCSDHRLIDGDVMSAFHTDVCRTLSNPIGLLL